MLKYIKIFHQRVLIMTHKIVLKKKYDYNITTTINQFVTRIYKIYDINTAVIESWLNSEEFDNALSLIDTKCFNSCIKGNNKLLNKLQNITQHDIFIDTNLSWEKEKCGHIIMEYSNGYIKYCNGHKYLHKPKTDDLIEDITLTKKDIVYNHVFVEKNSKEIIDEQIFKLKYNMYLNYSRSIIQELHILFDKMIATTYSLLYVPRTQAPAVLQYLNDNQSDFKEKCIKSEADDEIEYIAVYCINKPVPELPFQFIHKHRPT